MWFDCEFCGGVVWILDVLGVDVVVFESGVCVGWC